MPTPLEIERKYLIEYPDISWLESCPDIPRSEIIQTYLLASPGEERRVRMRREEECVTYYYTIKRKVTAVTREELETVITKTQYDAYLSEADPQKHPLHKTRYCVPCGDVCVEIDVYPFWQHQAIAEVELEREDASVMFPPEIKVIREVTGETAYKNSELAKQ